MQVFQIPFSPHRTLERKTRDSVASRMKALSVIKYWLTSPVSVAVPVLVGIAGMGLPQLVQTKVRYFQDEPRVHEAVGRLEVAVAPDLRWVQVAHAPDYVVDERAPEDSIELKLLVFQDVLRNGKEALGRDECATRHEKVISSASLQDSWVRKR